MSRSWCCWPMAFYNGQGLKPLENAIKISVTLPEFLMVLFTTKTGPYLLTRDFQCLLVNHNPWNSVNLADWRLSAQ
jgi:hypothetical protein